MPVDLVTEWVAYFEFVNSEREEARAHGTKKGRV